MPGIEVEVIQPREPSVEFIRDMIQDADDKFTEWTKTKPTVEEKYIWIRQQLIDLIQVNKMLKKKEEEGPKDIDKEIVDTLLKNLQKPF